MCRDRTVQTTLIADCAKAPRLQCNSSLAYKNLILQKKLFCGFWSYYVTIQPKEMYMKTRHWLELICTLMWILTKPLTNYLHRWAAALGI